MTQTETNCLPAAEGFGEEKVNETAQRDAA
jgi:hypothetical protein